MRFVRIQVTYSGKLGYPVGIFGACHHLRRAGVLSPEDDRRFRDLDAWFEHEMPSPPFYSDGNSVRGITWFKTTATHLLEALAPLKALLEKHNVEYQTVETDDPGTIFYEDAFQVGVIDPKFPTQGRVARDEETPTHSAPGRRCIESADQSGVTKGPRRQTSA